MNFESRPLLLMLALAVSTGAAVSTASASPVPDAPRASADVMTALKASAQQQLASLLATTPSDAAADGQTAQFFNFPQFPNYFRNCFYGYWRNC